MHQLFPKMKKCLETQKRKNKSFLLYFVEWAIFSTFRLFTFSLRVMARRRKMQSDFHQEFLLGREYHGCHSISLIHERMQMAYKHIFFCPFLLWILYSNLHVGCGCAHKQKIHLRVSISLLCLHLFVCVFRSTFSRQKTRASE